MDVDMSGDGGQQQSPSKPSPPGQNAGANAANNSSQMSFRRHVCARLCF